MRQHLTATNKLYGGIMAADPLLDGRGPLAIDEAWRRGDITTEELGWEMLRLIEEDVADGVIPWDVTDFNEAHNYVDANEYGLQVLGFLSAEDIPGYTEDADPYQDRTVELVNTVTAWVHAKLTGGDDRPYWDRYSGEFDDQGRRLDQKNVRLDYRNYALDMGCPHLDYPRDISRITDMHWVPRTAARSPEWR